MSDLSEILEIGQRVRDAMGGYAPKILPHRLDVESSKLNKLSQETYVTRGDDAGYGRLFLEYVTGLGPGSHHFRDGDKATELLKRHTYLREVRRRIAAGQFVVGKRIQDNFSLGDWYGMGRYLDALIKKDQTAARFLGSFNLSFVVTDVRNGHAKVKFHAWNQTTPSSAFRLPLYGYGRRYNDSFGRMLDRTFTSGPLSPISQTFDWGENIRLNETAMAR